MSTRGIFFRPVYAGVLSVLLSANAAYAQPAAAPPGPGELGADEVENLV